MMKLAKLVEELQKIEHIEVILPEGATLNAAVGDVVYDSRKVAPGDVFTCVTGEKSDGHDYAAAATEAGCGVMICERKVDTEVPVIITRDSRSLMGYAAAALEGYPARKLTMIAATGTNGKSTSCYMVRSILSASGHTTGMLGTIIYSDGIEDIDADRTTPEGPDIQRWLGKMVTNGCTHCVMEASSHGLEQGRLSGCTFDYALFSNLTQDHLDYHGDMENYFAAKKLLFKNYMRGDWRGVANIDDPYGARLAAEFSGHLSTYGKNGDYRATVQNVSTDGMTIDIITPGAEYENIFLPLLGAYNVQNALQSAGVCLEAGSSGDDIRAGLLNMPQVPGRLERYKLSRGFYAVIDYAHTPDGLQNVLTTLRGVCSGNLWAVWGAGGDRTPAKRPISGEVMARLADAVIVTTDNPRSEKPADIAKSVAAGVERSSRKVGCNVILDRKEAICYALDHAQPGDVVLIAGKGPEKYMEIKGVKHPFLDADVLAGWCRDNGVEAAS